MGDIQLFQQVLDAYNNFDYNNFQTVKSLETAMEAIRDRIAQGEPKKAIVLRGQKGKVVGLYYEDGEEKARTEMPVPYSHKEWQGLTDEEQNDSKK